MRRILRHRPSPALVVACLALTIALGGTSYAAVTLPRNSVGTAQLKTNAVNSAKVKNRSLRAIDFRRGQLPRGARGLQGLPGATGATGATGAAGAAGAKGDKGDPGEAVAYALISSGGVVNTAFSKGITAAMVTKPAATTGVYCFNGLGFTPKNVVASGDNLGPTLDTLASGALNGAGGSFIAPNCAGQQARVTTFAAGAAAAAENRAFFVWFED